MRELINRVQCLFEDTVPVDESLNQPFPFQAIPSDLPGDSDYRRVVKSHVKLPDGSDLVIHAAQSRPNLFPFTRPDGSRGRKFRSYWMLGFARSEKEMDAPPDEDSEEDWSQWHDGTTGQGLQQRVFATVLEFIRELIQEHQPDEIRFQAETESSRRVSLYHRMAQRYAGSLGYNVKMGPDPESRSHTRFIIQKEPA